MKKSPLLARLRYRFDNTLSRGPIALIGWLGLAAALLVLAATALVLLWPGATPDGLDAGKVFWDILSQALTPNPVADTFQWQFLLVMFFVSKMTAHAIPKDVTVKMLRLQCLM